MTPHDATREALEFYADPENYDLEAEACSPAKWTSPVDDDGGAKARAALASARAERGEGGGKAATTQPPEHDAIHLWFELSYAQYLSIPRSVLQSMPDEWQQRFVRCLEELDERMDWRPKDGHLYRVTLHKPDYDYRDFHQSGQAEDDAWDKGEEWEEFDEEKFWGPNLRDPLGNYDRGSRVVPLRAPGPGVPRRAEDGGGVASG